jgi:hypothetical protein
VPVSVVVVVSVGVVWAPGACVVGSVVVSE